MRRNRMHPVLRRLFQRDSKYGTCSNQAATVTDHPSQPLFDENVIYQLITVTGYVRTISEAYIGSDVINLIALYYETYDENINGTISFVAKEVFYSDSKESKFDLIIHDDLIDFQQTTFMRKYDSASLRLDYISEYFCRMITNTEPKVLKRYWTRNVLRQMFISFNNNDIRQQLRLKNILYCIWNRYPSFHSFIIKCLCSILHQVIYDTFEAHYGIIKLMEFVGYIIPHFQIPLNDEYTKLLCNTLIPLHKVSYLQLLQFHDNLCFCMIKFIQKQHNLSSVIIGGLIKFWPILCCSKQLLYLNELEQILEVIIKNDVDLNHMIMMLFYVISKSVNSNHFCVAQKALSLMGCNHIITQYIFNHRKRIFPIIYPSLQTNHWNHDVSTLKTNINQTFCKNDVDLWLSFCK